MRIKETIKYVLSESKNDPQTPMSWDLGRSWVVATPNSKTAKAVCWHAWEYGWGPVLEVEFNKPMDWIETVEDSGDELRIYAVADEVEIKTLTSGNERVRVSFYRRFQNGQPVVNGKFWMIRPI